jgi:DNA polymerase/3'-5' exonuclease PolX
MENINIINEFKLLIEQIKLEIDYSVGKQQIINLYRLSSIKKVLELLEKYPKKITSSKQLEGIKKIGKKSLIRIDEILKTGKLSEIKINSQSINYLKVISELEDVFGIGRKKAYELFMKYSITSVEDLKLKAKNKLITLPNNILKGLEYVGKINTNIPRNEINKFNIIFDNITLSISPKLFGSICGSYRRGSDKSGDIDYILFHTELINKSDINKSKINYLEKFVNALKNKKIIIESLTADNVLTKYMGISKLYNGDYCRIDIRFIQYESYYPAMLYFTGPSDLNKKMRKLAESHKYLLNEYGLFDSNNKMFNVDSENMIFKLIGMDPLIPTNR